MNTDGNDTPLASVAWSIPSIVTIAASAALLTMSASALTAEPFGIDTTGMPGFAIVTSDDGRMSAEDMVVIEYAGPIAFPMAENLDAIWAGIRKADRFRRVVLRLNSAGGDGLHGEQVVAVLARIRETMAFSTLVGDGDLCASMCIGVFIQGETRYASPASSWMFHGASANLGNIPDPNLTARYFDLFHARQVGSDFIDRLYQENQALAPGGYWVSGNELAQASDIITILLPNWRPADPEPGLPGIVRGGV